MEIHLEVAGAELLGVDVAEAGVRHQAVRHVVGAVDVVNIALAALDAGAACKKQEVRNTIPTLCN